MARLVTSGQLAEELGLSLRTIQRYIASEPLPTWQTGRSAYVRRGLTTKK
ncbi:helix-turn-helix domain-containing protein [Pseudonocardia artemisiae]